LSGKRFGKAQLWHSVIRLERLSKPTQILEFGWPVSWPKFEAQTWGQVVRGYRLKHLAVWRKTWGKNERMGENMKIKVKETRKRQRQRVGQKRKGNKHNKVEIWE